MNNSSSSSTGAQKPSGDSTGPAPQAPVWRAWHEESGPEPVKALTREQVQQLGLQRPSVSVWQVLLWQALVGVVMALALGLWSGRWSWALSLLYGAAAVVVPGLVFARGLTGRLASINPGTAVMGFFVWEFVKIGLTLALLPTRRLNPQVDRLEQQGYAKVTAPFQTSVCFYESAAL